jgi:hypothetical protein
LLVVAELVDQPPPLPDADAVVRGEILGSSSLAATRLRPPGIFFRPVVCRHAAPSAINHPPDFGSTARLRTNQKPLSLWY